jgi:pilus assembly protein CpaE
MACSTKQDMKLAIRYMRVGVREFFTLPADSAEVVAALGRAADRPITVQAVSKPISKLFVFLGTKGGVGVTTLAANFALSISKLSDKEKRTLIIDLGLPLGDVAINLGIRTEYSVLNALIDPVRLDGNFLDSVVTKHSSGLAVLGAPVEFSDLQPPIEAFDKLISVACNNYDFIIVDAGSRVDLFTTTLFEKCTTIYLITQVGISELRNAHRIINHFFSARSRSLQVVLNRYTQRALLFDDAQISKTISRDADWKIPDDYAAARRNRESATPVALVESTLAAAIRKMAREAAEIPVEKKKKKGLFGF